MRAKFWTGHELTRLRQLAGEGYTRVQTAAQLGRTPRSVEGMSYRLGVRFRGRNEPDHHKRLQLLDLLKRGLTLTQAAREIGVHHGTVWKRARRLLRDGVLTQVDAHSKKITRYVVR